MKHEIVQLDEKAASDFWRLRKELFLELGEVSDETDISGLKAATERYYLSHINKDLLSWGIYQEEKIVAIGSLCLFSRIPYQENLSGSEAYILNIYTSEHFRKRGFASQILDTIMEYGEWVTRSDPFIDDWSEADYQVLIDCLRNTLRTDGLVYGAFINGVLKGFVSVESKIFGEKYKYMDLSSLHVSEDARRNVIGRSLFIAAANWARKCGAEKLYIFAHSAVETQAFYISMGCSDAAEYNQEHVSAEPYDRQMEYAL